MTKAIALCRVSTKGQADDGHSLAHQSSSVAQMATVLEAEIVQTWAVAVSSKKGRNLKRKDILQALQYCRRHPGVKYLFIDTVSRFMRDLEMVFYYRVQFRKLGVKLIFCDPELHELNEDDAKASKKLAEWAYDAERENEVRTHISKTNMLDRVKKGYYPFYPHQGYKKTELENGLHVPDEPRFSLLQHAFKEMAALRMTIEDAVRWLSANQYTTKGGDTLDSNRLKEMMQDKYFAGMVSVRNWPGEYKGLHQPMITLSESGVLNLIAQNKPLRKRLQFNPAFRLNKSWHDTCRTQDGKLTGIVHSNGKGWTRDEYVCRSCKKRIPRYLIEESMDKLLSQLTLKPEYQSSLITELERVWISNEGYRNEKTNELQKVRNQLKAKKNELIGAMVKTPALAEDFTEAIEETKIAISCVDKQLVELGTIQQEYHSFMRYALAYVENLRARWWELEADNFGECKTLIFNDEIIFDIKGKVYTPNLSPIFSLENKNDDPKVVENAKLVELAGTAPASAGLSWLVVYRHSSF